MIERDRLPELDEPVLLAGFEGWNDAADAASGVVTHLVDQWDGEQVGELEPDDYYDFQVNRPTVAITEDGRRELTWPTTSVLVARPPAAPRDIVLIRGIEPNMRWRPFCAELVDLSTRLGVKMAILVGALLADTPHSRPIPVTATATDPALCQQLGLEQSKYEGPTGILGALQDAFERAGVPAVSLWAAVPHYVAQPPCPKATLALVRKAEDILDVSIPLGDLPDEAQAWERGVNELARDDSDVAEYVRSLEQARDAAELPEASGEAIAREFERYLRRRGTGGPAGR